MLFLKNVNEVFNLYLIFLSGVEVCVKVDLIIFVDVYVVVFCICYYLYIGLWYNVFLGFYIDIMN